MEIDETGEKGHVTQIDGPSVGGQLGRVDRSDLPPLDDDGHIEDDLSGADVEHPGGANDGRRGLGPDSGGRGNNQPTNNR